jgi:hypothetical protein
MKEIRLRKIHRRVGILMAFFLVLQAGTGLIMPLRLFPTLYDFFGLVHYGSGMGGSIYRIFLSIGTFVTAITGTMIFFKIRARSRQQ